MAGESAAEEKGGCRRRADTRLIGDEETGRDLSEPQSAASKTLLKRLSKCSVKSQSLEELQMSDVTPSF